MLSFILINLLLITGGDSLKIGEEAEKGQFKYLAAVIKKNKFICAGSIIDETHVLTVGHHFFAIAKNDISVVVGSVDLNLRTDTRIQVDRIYVHPGLKERTYPNRDLQYWDNNVAVLKLKNRIKWNRHVGPYNLGLLPPDHSVCQPCMMIAWDTIGLRHVVLWNTIFILSPDTCEEVNIFLGKNQRCFIDDALQLIINSENIGAPIVCADAMIGMVSIRPNHHMVGAFAVFLDIFEYTDFIHGVVTNGLTSVPLTEKGVPTKFPYIVTIFHGDTYICGGSILDATHILTSGHCVHEKNPSDLRVLTKFTEIAEIQVEIYGYAVDHVVFYDKYEKFRVVDGEEWYINHDFAILVLKHELPIERYAQSLPYLDAITPVEKQKCEFPLWKAHPTDYGTKSHDLKKTQLTISAAVPCERAFADKGLPVAEGQFCAYHEYSLVTTDPGDSGTPLICDGKLTGIFLRLPPSTKYSVMMLFISMSSYKEFITSVITREKTTPEPATLPPVTTPEPVVTTPITTPVPVVAPPAAIPLPDVPRPVVIPEPPIVIPPLPSPTPEPVNEGPVEPGEFNYVVSVQKFNVHYCTGTIIDETRVLTVAHMVVFDVTGNPSVLVGATKQQPESGLRIPIKTFYRHGRLKPSKIPDTDKVYYEHDIVIIQLSEKLKWSANVGPVNRAIAPSNTLDNPECKILSWGDEKPPVLSWSRVSLLDHQKCDDKSVYIGVNQRCFSDKTGRLLIDDGKLGAPIVCDGSLVGMVETAPQHKVPGDPAVFLEISEYSSWFTDIINGGLYDVKTSGGVPAEFPYIVSIWTDKSGAVPSYKCAGSIVAGTVILTTAHCVHKEDPNNLKVFAGLAKLTSQSYLENGRSVKRIEKNLNAPFSMGIRGNNLNFYATNDLTLLILAESLPFELAVSQLRYKHTTEVSPLQSCVLPIWKKKTSGLVLKTANVEITPDDYCKKAMEAVQMPVIVDQFCGRNMNSLRVADLEDNGSPLICDGKVVGILVTGKASVGKYRAEMKFQKILPHKDYITSVITKETSTTL